MVWSFGTVELSYSPAWNFAIALANKYKALSIQKCYDKLSESYWSLMPYPKIGLTEPWIWRSFLARYLQRASQGLSSLESN